MRELNHKEGWVMKNWCFWTVVLEKTLESPLNCKEIKPVNPKGSQSWSFIGRTDADAETPYLGHRMWRADSLEKTDGWERLKAGGEGDDRGPEGRKTSLTQWRWVWASSSRWRRTGKSGMLQPMELQSQTWLSDWTTIKCNVLESPWSHPSLPVPPVRGKILFYETGP